MSASSPQSDEGVGGGVEWNNTEQTQSWVSSGQVASCTPALVT